MTCSPLGNGPDLPGNISNVPPIVQAGAGALGVIWDAGTGLTLPSGLAEEAASAQGSLAIYAMGAGADVASGNISATQAGLGAGANTIFPIMGGAYLWCSRRSFRLRNSWLRNSCCRYIWSSTGWCTWILRSNTF